MMYIDLGLFEQIFSHMIGWTKNNSNKKIHVGHLEIGSTKENSVALDHSET